MRRAALAAAPLAVLALVPAAAWAQQQKKQSLMSQSLSFFKCQC